MMKLSSWWQRLKKSMFRPTRKQALETPYSKHLNTLFGDLYLSQRNLGMNIMTICKSRQNN